MNNERILVVEDDPVVLKVLESGLRNEGYEVVCARDAHQAAQSAQEQEPDLMILDLTLVNEANLNGILDGFSLLHWMRYFLPDHDFPVIIHTGDPSPAVERHAKETGVYAVFRKGTCLSELLAAVRKALDERMPAE